FFFFVLAGEDPIDHVQRKALAARDLHPLVRRVTQIHVTEEARHVAFANAFLADRVPRLSPARRVALAAAIPLILAFMARVMLRPQADVVAAHAIPERVLVEAYSLASPLYRRQVIDSLAGIRELCQKLGLYHPAVWRALKVAA
ncbi:MAG TPA: diiron oxygenase, partial [Haliangiales bacterium]|nr:diiron oxygenase [Haliangiales bacterium]